MVHAAGLDLGCLRALVGSPLLGSIQAYRRRIPGRGCTLGAARRLEARGPCPAPRFWHVRPLRRANAGEEVRRGDAAAAGQGRLGRRSSSAASPRSQAAQWSRNSWRRVAAGALSRVERAARIAAALTRVGDRGLGVELAGASLRHGGPPSRVTGALHTFFSHRACAGAAPPRAPAASSEPPLLPRVKSATCRDCFPPPLLRARDSGAASHPPPFPDIPRALRTPAATGEAPLQAPPRPRLKPISPTPLPSHTAASFAVAPRGKAPAPQRGSAWAAVAFRTCGGGGWLPRPGRVPDRPSPRLQSGSPRPHAVAARCAASLSTLPPDPFRAVAAAASGSELDDPARVSGGSAVSDSGRLSFPSPSPFRCDPPPIQPRGRRVPTPGPRGVSRIYDARKRKSTDACHGERHGPGGHVVVVERLPPLTWASSCVTCASSCVTCIRQLQAAAIRGFRSG
eukprot:363474-Chlamydomonas_euryale.AAC.9